MRDKGSDSSALLDFLLLYQDDLASGRVQPLEAYIARFPEIEDGIRAEFADLQESRSTKSVRPSQEDPIPAATLNQNDLMEHLSGRFEGPQRYQREDEIGRGGMSRVYRARDFELGRELAMKVNRTDRPGILRRFIREARVLASLDHPGVVPVHELGLDASGRVYFTMRLVRGQSLKERLHEPRTRPQLVNQREVLEAILRVCDTMAYAHSQGVIHRDLKPANIMLGHFGEVYVVDWGLAHLMAQPLESEAPAGQPWEESEQALETLAGDVLGTPSYMSPEQARGDLDSVGPRSDVYSVGAILYHCLAAHAPFLAQDSGMPSSEVLRHVLLGPPISLRVSAPGAHSELVSICERAMARSPEDRYASCAEMAADLRAFLDGRVVAAHKTSFLTRMGKWVLRNRSLSAASFGALILAVGALYSWSEAQAKEQHLNLLADLRGPLEMLEEFPALWPADAEHARAIEHWIARAEGLRERVAHYRDQLGEIRKHGERVEDSDWVRGKFALEQEQLRTSAIKARDATKNLIRVAMDRGTKEDLAKLDLLRRDLESLERRVLSLTTITAEKESRNFSVPLQQLLHDRLDQFLMELEFVVGREAPSERLTLAQTAMELVSRATVTGTPELDRLWQAAALAVGADPRFNGLVLTPQSGLIPIGPDPHSGFWEFAHQQSGEAPTRDDNGELMLTDEVGVVLVLLPPANYVVGAQSADPTAELFDPHMERAEGPLIEVDVDAFLISKYELSLAQWSRLSGEPADQRLAALGLAEVQSYGLFPAGGMRGDWSKVVLAAYDLELCTSIYWEYAARAGTTTPWWCGSELTSLEGAGNIADKSWQQAMNYPDTFVAGAVPFNDGHSSLAPIGSYRPNAFGLHDTIGNVSEWCRDITIPNMTYFLIEGRELAPQASGLQILRGGSAADAAYASRSAARRYVKPDWGAAWNGVRPMRRVQSQDGLHH